MTLCKEVTRDQERGTTQCCHQLTVSPLGYLTLLGFRYLETQGGAIIPSLAIAGSSEPI